MDPPLFPLFFREVYIATTPPVCIANAGQRQSGNLPAASGNVMTKKIYFISGLPRSGSTLFSALLRQNPRFHADISSPVAPMCNALLNVMGVKSEFSTRFTETQKTELLRGIFNNYYKPLPAGTVIFDSNRSWCARLALLNQLFSDFRMICCVRNVAWIMDSFERLVQENPLVYSRMFNDDNERGTVYSRAEALARGITGLSVTL